MGCGLCGRKLEVDIGDNQINENRYKHLYYATNEFDLSKSDDEYDSTGERTSSATAKVTPPMIELNKSISTIKQEHLQNKVMGCCKCLDYLPIKHIV